MAMMQLLYKYRTSTASFCELWSLCSLFASVLQLDSATDLLFFDYFAKKPSFVFAHKDGNRTCSSGGLASELRIL